MPRTRIIIYRNTESRRDHRLLAALLFVSLVVLPPCLQGAALAEEPKDKRPVVRVAVDPRVELVSIVFRLAGNPEYGRGRVEAYTKDVEAHFGKFRDHEVVKLARKLRQTRGVSYDACMSMAVLLGDPDALTTVVPLEPRPESLDARWTVAAANEFLAALRAFVKESRFREFCDAHRGLYELTEARMRAVIKQDAHLEWFDDFFGERPGASFTVALALLNGGSCYGPHCRTADGREELYCVLGVWQTDDEGNPQFDRDVLGTVIHEFCHSYTNAIVDRHEEELRPAGERIYPHVAAAMQSQAYGNWKTMMYESLVRACVLRYTRRHGGWLAALRQSSEEKERQFQWVGELSELLGEYETSREKYPTLEAFSPRIVAFFNAYADKSAKEQDAVDAKRPKVVSITPADGATNVDPALAKIVVVFDRPMNDGGWSMVGGGPHFPEIVGKPSYDGKRTTWSVSVKLKADWDYEFMLNSARFTAFQAEDGTPLAPVKVRFETGHEAGVRP